MTRSRFVLLIALAASVLPAGACNQRNSPTSVDLKPIPETRDEEGWPIYEVKSEGFVISLPPTWRQFDMNPRDVRG